MIYDKAKTKKDSKTFDRVFNNTNAFFVKLNYGANTLINHYIVILVLLRVQSEAESVLFPYDRFPKTLLEMELTLN